MVQRATRAQNTAPLHLFVRLISCLGTFSATIAQQRLHFVQETFKVVQLTDLHLGEGEGKDAATLKAVVSVLNAESDADLIVLSGDMVSGFRNTYSTHGWFESVYSPLIQKLAMLQKPRVVVQGNHDSEGLLNRTGVILVDQSFPSSFSLLGPHHLTGEGNYWVDIMPPGTASNGLERSMSDGIAMEESREEPAVRLWFLDSMSRGCAGIPGWGCVGPDVSDWLRSMHATLPPAAAAAAFIHIPPPEFLTAWRRGAAVGVKAEAVCCPSCNSGVVDALRAGGVDAIYSGHDHDNDFAALWNGTRYAYGRKTGYGSYGPSRGRLKGARVIVLRQAEAARDSQTYLRLEDGTALYQAAACKRFWVPQQWACEPGIDSEGIGFEFPHTRVPA